MLTNSTVLINVPAAGAISHARKLCTASYSGKQSQWPPLSKGTELDVLDVSYVLDLPLSPDCIAASLMIEHWIGLGCKSS